MNDHASSAQAATAQPLLVKADPTTPALKLVGAADALVIKAGTVFAGHAFDRDTPVELPADGLEPGADYAVVAVDLKPAVLKLIGTPSGDLHLGGFHFAPGGNAVGRSGGDSTPQINPHSLWDLNFRPACPDPRGMVLVDAAAGRFWCDIYLLGVDHLTNGTSKLGVLIADGDDPPLQPDGEAYDKLDYETAIAVMKHHGKGLLSFDEFVAAAYGVTEKTASSKDPKTTKLDAPRTSKWGLMQATGNLWVWGHDGDPDLPRASFFGGSWFNDVLAGSRHAAVAYYWPDYSVVYIGARGRGDHLQLG